MQLSTSKALGAPTPAESYDVKAHPQADLMSRLSHPQDQVNRSSILFPLLPLLSSSHVEFSTTREDACRPSDDRNP